MSKELLWKLLVSGTVRHDFFQGFWIAEGKNSRLNLENRVDVLLHADGLRGKKIMILVESD